MNIDNSKFFDLKNLEIKEKTKNNILIIYIKIMRRLCL